VWFYVGKSDAHISVLKNGFEGVELDENNKPREFKKKLTNMRTVAYSTNNRITKTASGRPTVPGNVAVRFDDIKLGTKLFIVSKDGKFVYGNAVAADTGSSLVAGTCDLDVVVDSYPESCWFGSQDMECYVLED
jgi:3D (Asp-Asp-Asp) domain-containing protein